MNNYTRPKGDGCAEPVAVYRGGVRGERRSYQPSKYAAPLGARDDALASRARAPGWKFDPKSACLVR